MAFDWTTFVLEILNFLVLVWILKRFLYRPVLAVLDARQQRLKDEAAQARRLQQEAEELKARYEKALADWASERELARRKLGEELAQARAVGIEGMKKSLAELEAKARARADALAAAGDAALSRQAAEQGYGAAAAMLTRLACAALTARIAEIFIEDLGALPQAQLAPLRNAARSLEAGAAMEIASAHPLDEPLRARVQAALVQGAGRALEASFRPAPELVAGLRVVVGECLLHANLADELEFFRRQGQA